MKIRSVFSVFLFLFASLLLCTSSPASQTIKDARNKTIVIPKRINRIVSISPSNTEILFALGLDSKIVGVTKFCNYPPSAKKKSKVGDLNISTEAVLNLKPDIVIAHATLNDSAISKLEHLHIPVFAVDPKTIGQTYTTIMQIGKITGTTPAARKLVKSMQVKLTSIKRSHVKTKGKSVLFVVQANPLWIAGPRTLPNEMLGILNASNIAHDSRSGFVNFSEELAVSRNPDLIVVGTKSDARYFKRSSIWKNTSAVKHHKVLIINPDLIVRPGPRLVNGLTELSRQLTF